jgi:hypothetical protein
MIEKEKELNKAAQRLVFLSDYLQVGHIKIINFVSN